MMPRLQTKLESMEASRIVKKVDKPTDWVNSLVVVKKINKDIRPCLDSFDLNKAIEDEKWYTPTPDEILNSSGGKTRNGIHPQQRRY